MANDTSSAEELLLDVRVAEASALYKFYLNHEKGILGGIASMIFLAIWELAGNVLQLINPMFMSAPSLIAKAAIDMFASGLRRCHASIVQRARIERDRIGGRNYVRGDHDRTLCFD